MTITPADSLNLLIAKGPPDATNFANQIANLPNAYWSGLDEAYKRRTQDAFQNLDPNAPIDPQALYKKLLIAGGTPSAIAVAQGLQQQGILEGLQKLPGAVFGNTGEQSPTTSGAPPSTAPTSVAAPALRSTSGPPGSSNGSSPTSVNAAVSQAGFSGDEAGSLITRISQGFKIDPDQNLDPVMQAQVATAVQRAVQARQQTRPATAAAAPAAAPPSGPVATPTLAFNDRFAGAPAPPPSTVPSQEGMASVTNDPTLGGLVPPGRTYQQQLRILQQAAGRAEAAKAGAGKIYQDAAAKIEERLLPTNEYKNYLAGHKPGETFPDWLDRDARDKRETAILQHSILPKLDKSQEGAMAARDDVLAISRARDQLDADKGIISGITAGRRLDLQKIGTLFGFDDRQVANTEAFRAAIGSRVTSIVKALGSGTAISNSDRVFAEKMSGGDIKLDESSIRRILDIGVRAAQARIAQHNTLVDRTLKSSPDLQRYGETYHVDIPTTGKTVAAPPVPGAKQAPDGNFYVPDPNRPGKYLQVK
jgi:hypothetical protein